MFNSTSEDLNYTENVNFWNIKEMNIINFIVGLNLLNIWMNHTFYLKQAVFIFFQDETSKGTIRQM